MNYLETAKKLFVAKGDDAPKLSANDVPAEPGSTPVAPGMARLYHYTRATADELRTNGIDLSRAKGESYGEPNMVWASFQKPENHHIHAEFQVHMDDPGWSINKPQDQSHLDRMTASGSDVTFNRSIKPSEFIAIHEPWHARYRYAMSDPNVVGSILAGEHDDLLGDREYGSAIAKIKRDHSQSNI